tara:strand:- start:175 stop:309 length:135 start_codon:yes stop_codon:yes gene_type:complete
VKIVIKKLPWEKINIANVKLFNSKSINSISLATENGIEISWLQC